MIRLALILVIVLVVFSGGSHRSRSTLLHTRALTPGTEEKAVAFLSREVPAWSKRNGCFSCHNNGDGARALFVASQKGYKFAADVLADTKDWISRPQTWDENKGDPGFSDKNLADIQFSASLSGAIDAGVVTDATSLLRAVERLIKHQAPDGSWHIEPQTVLGSPATYGTPLATYMAFRTLRKAHLSGSERSIAMADSWLARLKPQSTLDAATGLLAAVEGASIPERNRTECLKLISTSQTRDGGWGPYPNSPAEPFDTALAIIALSSISGDQDLRKRIEAGRRFLLAEQEEDGSWAATTRPPRGESYAQKISTTAWATIALLSSR